MAVSRYGIDQVDARPAASDLTGKLYYIAELDGSGQVQLCGDGELAYGVITEENTAGNSVTVQSGGIAKVILGGTVDENAKVACDADGKAVAGASGDYIIGVCRKGGAANEIGEVSLTFPGRVA